MLVNAITNVIQCDIIVKCYPKNIKNWNKIKNTKIIAIII